MTEQAILQNDGSLSFVPLKLKEEHLAVPCMDSNEEQWIKDALHMPGHEANLPLAVQGLVRKLRATYLPLLVQCEVLSRLVPAKAAHYHAQCRSHYELVAAAVRAKWTAERAKNRRRTKAKQYKPAPPNTSNQAAWNRIKGKL